MSGLLDGLMQDMGSDGVNAIAGKLGMSSGQAQQAIQAALPMIVAAMSRNSNDPQGASALQSALQDHGSDVPMQQKLQQVTQQATPDNDALGILGHIFGSKQSAAAQGISHAAGIDSGNATNLMGMLAPLVMSYLGKQMLAGKLNPSQIGSALGQEANNASSGGIGSIISAVLDQGAGSSGGPDLAGMLKMGSSILGAFGRK